MNDIRVYKAYPSDLNFLESFSLVSDHFKDCGYKENPNICEKSIMVLRLSDSRTLTTGRFHSLLKILQQYPSSKSVSIHTHWQIKRGPLGWVFGGHFRFMMDIDQSSIIVSVQSKDLNLIAGIHEKVRDIFRASSPEPARSPGVSRSSCKKSVFLAHRFDEMGREMSLKVQTLLQQLGFDVRDGEGYETKSIPEKVTERIRSQDILICLVTPGDSSWLLSEAAFAKGLGKNIIVLLQEGASFKKGIIGVDYEHLQFPPGNVEKVFNDLLYCLPS